MAIEYPLTKKVLNSAFAELAPQSILVHKQPGWHEASVDGSWRLSQLRRHFKALGFKPTGHPDDLLFVNEDSTVGLQCFGVDPHPTKNTYMTFCVEVQARSLSDAKDGVVRGYMGLLPT